MMHALAFAGVFLAAERDAVGFVKHNRGSVWYAKDGSVQKVMLRGDKFKDDNLRPLRGLVHVRLLILRKDCPLKNLDTLPPLPCLTGLVADGTAITDRGVITLVSRCPFLQSVSLQNTKVTYATFDVLASLPDLQLLRILRNEGYPEGVLGSVRKVEATRKKANRNFFIE
jgi:hypothetical protein